MWHDSVKLLKSATGCSSAFNTGSLVCSSSAVLSTDNHLRYLCVSELTDVVLEPQSIRKHGLAVSSCSSLCIFWHRRMLIPSVAAVSDCMSLSTKLMQSLADGLQSTG